MNKKDIDIIKRFQKQNVEIKDIFGTHKGVIHTLKIKDNGMFAYALFFGMNVWLRLNEETLEWEEVN